MTRRRLTNGIRRLITLDYSFFISGLVVGGKVRIQSGLVRGVRGYLPIYKFRILSTDFLLSGITSFYVSIIHGVEPQ